MDSKETRKMFEISQNTTRFYISPKTIKGETKTLGVWDFDGFYTDFKTLGAKRYIFRRIINCQ